MADINLPDVGFWFARFLIFVLHSVDVAFGARHRAFFNPPILSQRR